MKQLLLSVFSLVLALSLQAQVNLTLDVSCSDNATPNEVRLSGPFWGWDVASSPVAADNGNGTWTVTLETTPTENMEYLWYLDGTQENLIQSMIDGGDCAPVTDFATYANRLWEVGEGDQSDTYASCEACAVDVVELLSLTFDDATSVNAWEAVADATLPEASYQWNDTGVETGALQFGGSNTSDGIGRAYIFQYNGAMDYQNASSVQLSFDVIASQPLVGAALHLQTNFPGLGVTNNFDTQNMGINEITWTTLTFDFDNIGQGDFFGMHFNIAAGAFLGAGGELLVDNITLTKTATGNTGGGGPLELTVEVCDSLVNEVRMTGPFWGWDPNGGPIAADNGDGTYTVTLDPAPNENMEYLWVVDGVQENLIQVMIDGGTCAPVTDFFSYANRLWETGSGNEVMSTYGQCTACNPSNEVLDLTLTICDDSTPNEVRITGPFWGWDPNAGPVATMNGDGTWTVSLDPAPSENMEYLWIVDGVQENLIQAMIDGGSCAPVTDFFSYANRQWIVGTPDMNDTYNQCTACNTGNVDVTLTVEVCGPAANEVRMTGAFWGWDPAGGPVATDNGDGTWSVLLSPAPSENMEYLWVVDGTMENLIQAMVDGGDCAPVTDFATFANRLWNVGDADVTGDVYGQCTACDIVVDVEGCTDPEANNYNPEATIDDGSCMYDCAPLTATFDTNGCNDNEDPFSIDINVTDLGMSGPYTVTNSVNADEATIDATGILNYGSFVFGDEVIVTITSTVADSCFISSDLLFCPVGLDNISEANWNIYPNPANQNVNLDLAGLTQGTVEVSDLSGRVVYVLKLDGEQAKTTINTAAWANGIYQVRWTSKQATATRRLVVQH